MDQYADGQLPSASTSLGIGSCAVGVGLALDVRVLRRRPREPLGIRALDEACRRAVAVTERLHTPRVKPSAYTHT
jgi:hypothetical protein